MCQKCVKRYARILNFCTNQGLVFEWSGRILIMEIKASLFQLWYIAFVSAEFTFLLLNFHICFSIKFCFSKVHMKVGISDEAFHILMLYQWITWLMLAILLCEYSILLQENMLWVAYFVHIIKTKTDTTWKLLNLFIYTSMIYI